ncbi:hypothetical protein H6F32_00410 [Anabaena sp. FACHB-1237]|uniref:hypothetical protein n=1 Tax=Anabaena sp. FACHB-1237 TaxID=2692769 RepID=UPI001680F688|nr:hypothetical protein [Anabaena sp. FACHB-1237]MBD2136077.1 hypothetical protein [Anabaena sp. FACHB-1237]
MLHQYDEYKKDKFCAKIYPLFIHYSSIIYLSDASLSATRVVSGKRYLGVQSNTY